LDASDEVKVYDSLYNRVDDATKRKIEKALACKLRFIVPVVQKQQGYKAFATHLPFGKTQFNLNKTVCISTLQHSLKNSTFVFFITAT